MGNTAKGRYALFISDRSGLAFPYREMVKEWNGARVHTSEYEPKQPQLEPKPYTADPQGLSHPRPARTEVTIRNYFKRKYYCNRYFNYFNRLFCFSKSRLYCN